MLLYLDIDGVMVAANPWRRLEFLEDGFPVFESRATNALRRIISATDASIVLTTSHKHKYSLDEWKAIFERRGIDVQNIRRLPKNTSNLNRKDELMNWFSAQKQNTPFLIIDDDKSLNGLPQYLKEYLIQTSGSVGLTDYLASQAIETLERESLAFL